MISQVQDDEGSQTQIQSRQPYIQVVSHFLGNYEEVKFGMVLLNFKVATIAKNHVYTGWVSLIQKSETETSTKCKNLWVPTCHLKEMLIEVFKFPIFRLGMLNW